MQCQPMVVTDNAITRRSILMKTKMILFMLLAVTLAAAVPTPTPAQENDATAILKAMSDYVGNQKTIQLAFDSDIEIITPQLEKIQFTNSGEALLSRPDKLRAHRVGGFADVALFFDGKTVSIYGKHINGYAQFDAPGTVDQLIHALRQGHGVALPGADLLLTNSYDLLVAGVQEAKYIGQGVIDGIACEHLAFRNFDTDWQLWVEVGERPIPRKLVITSKTLNSAPQYTLRVKQWKTGHPAPPPPSTAKQLPPPPDKDVRRQDRTQCSIDTLLAAPRGAAEGAPNILLIITDDAGYGVSSTFGGVIPTPAMDRVAENGLRYTHFHSTAVCSPTRAALITGRNHHQDGHGRRSRNCRPATPATTAS
jgi:hypothetical protein